MGASFSKAFLLAAGLGTRLKPLTNRVPKCLVPIHGKPLLSIWLKICEGLGIREVLINTHHLSNQVQAWAKKQRTSIGIHLSHEAELLGSAGTVAANREFVRDEEDFFVFYVDNLVHADLESLKTFHCQHRGLITLGLFQTAAPEVCGIITVDDTGCVTSFEEKPIRPRSDLANAGIYVCRQALLECLPKRGFADFGKDVLPCLVGRMWGTILNGYLNDVGTPNNYRQALRDWPAVSRQCFPETTHIPCKSRSG